MKIKTLFPAAAALFVLTCASAPEPYSMEKRYLVAVPMFTINEKSDDSEDQTGEAGKRFRGSVQERIIDSLTRSGRARIIERDRINRLLEEQQLGETGLVDSGTASKIGKIAGVDAILMGDIKVIRLKASPSGQRVAVEYEATVTGRLVHAVTGEILASAMGKVKKTQYARRTGQRPVLKKDPESVLEAADIFISEFIKVIPAK